MHLSYHLHNTFNNNSFSFLIIYYLLEDPKQRKRKYKKQQHLLYQGVSFFSLRNQTKYSIKEIHRTNTTRKISTFCMFIGKTTVMLETSITINVTLVIFIHHFT